MKLFLMVAGTMAMSAALAAQTPPAAGPPTHLSVAGQMQSQYNIVKSNLTKLADKMPDDAYAFKPVNETRTFAQGLSPEALAATYTGTSVRGTERTPIEIERGGLAGNLIAHNNEMYGYLAVYLRMKGLVPPSSEGRAGRGGTH